jgi:peptide/nickel transport system substrate-binding protein
MDQMVVRFKLRAGLAWSDGQALSADDSVYSYELARAMYPKVFADLMDRTVAYQAVDETTLEWRGVPGYRTSAVSSLFFTPLPRHAWGNLALNDLLASEMVNRQPLGWGAYQIDEWTAGDHITLSKNPHYFRSGEGLPAFDRLVFRFIPDRAQALSALQAGECDLLDETNHLELQLQQLNELQASGKAAVAITPGIAWEHLDFGVQAASAPENGGPAAFFAKKETRQAVAYCLDRQRLVSELFPGQAALAESYISSGHPLFNPQARLYSYDPAKGAELLASAGWADGDNNPATPRTAQGVAGVPDGAAFDVTLYTADDDEKARAAQIIQEGLAGCGIKVTISAGPVETVFGPGPEGPVFGRNFALAQYGWTSSLEPPCMLYTTAEAPGPYPQFPRGWGGANASGYSNPEFDRACRQALTSLPGTPEYQTAHQQAQAIYNEDLPSLPLYLRLKATVTRPDLCVLPADPSSDSLLSSLEILRFGASCQ